MDQENAVADRRGGRARRRRVRLLALRNNENVTFRTEPLTRGNLLVAVADLYPHVTISGSLGFQASDLKNWFNPLSNFWSFGPGSAKKNGARNRIP